MLKPFDESTSAAVLESTVDELYRHRFPRQILRQRSAVWKILCESWLSRFIPTQARVVEVAAGYCEFINNVRAAERLAVDLNPETSMHAGPGVVVHQASAEDLAQAVGRNACDTVFMSNFLEHCRSRDHLLAVLRASAAVLKPAGRVLILGPNFRFCYKDYFDYLDHYLPLTEKAVEEALHLAGFDVEFVQARTLPYTFRGRLPQWPWLVRLYLRLPIFWPIFGKQYFLVARKRSGNASLRLLKELAA
jgi:SAM-dependent methyltransferase